ncbi:BrnA antitoxin family protein [Agrobacterium pusense]|uniref:BrnA antitoxin family protein n=1 Tax=Agrobacterium pusense TaxID=648995 RepID=UPI0028B11627|nr:BrnA antitoxin family protein [Agrobacterium pusense]
MKELIAKGGVHQDEDGWWVDTATGEMIGPDSEIERPLEADEQAKMKPLREALPELAKSIDREVARRGRPKAQTHKTPVTIRLDPEVVEHYKAMGKGWQSRINNDLRKLSGLR